MAGLVRRPVAGKSAALDNMALETTVRWKAAARIFPAPVCVLLLVLIGVLGDFRDAHGIAIEMRDTDFEPMAPVDLSKLQPDSELVEALSLIQRQSYEKAIQIVEAYLKLHPDSAPAHELYGIALAMQGKIDLGIAQLESAVRLNPNQVSALTKIGDVYMARKEDKKALDYFYQAVQTDPTYRWAHQRLGLLLEKEGRPAEAISHYEAGLKGTPPDYVGIKVNLANLYIRGGQYEKAASLLKPVAGKESRRPAALVAYGTALMGLNRKDEGLTILEAATLAAPEQPLPKLALGTAQREAGKLDESEKTLRAFVAEFPNESLGHAQLAETLVALGRFPEAIQSYETAIAKGAPEAALNNRIAQTFARAENFEKARATYERLIKDGKATMTTFDGLATLLELKGEQAEAGNVLLAALKKFPDSAFAKYRLGMHYGFLGEYDRSIDCLKQAHEMAPQDPRYLHALIVANSRAGNAGRALELARKLEALAPPNDDTILLLASLSEDAGNLDEAERLYARLLEMEPTHVVALNNLANVRLQQKDYAGAKEVAEKARTLAPENGFVLDTYGWVLFHNNDLPGARSALEQAASIQGASPSWKYHLAVVCAKTDEPDRARELLEQVLFKDVPFKEREEAEALLATLR